MRVIVLARCAMAVIPVREKFFMHRKGKLVRFMPDSEPEPPYEGAKPMLPVNILDDRTALRNMLEEMYPELPERKLKKKKV